ncbi:hypothetical protein TNCT_649171 [Trichonephila clavata]|uniref:Uncharacterized protein n=1 Tax=Trichonephila clavata TaxID=2740835 RepID=A0A8X6L8Z9_TRICU|nr:hypothetical protein TNCT_649171 [Trichonephila clavata]
MGREKGKGVKGRLAPVPFLSEDKINPFLQDRKPISMRCSFKTMPFRTSSAGYSYTLSPFLSFNTARWIGVCFFSYTIYGTLAELTLSMDESMHPELSFLTRRILFHKE